MTERKKLLMRLQATQFAAWELHMYLDTHPCDRTANEMFRKYTDEANRLRAEFEKYYGPLTVSNSYEASWLNDPWPWENQGGCDH